MHSAFTQIGFNTRSITPQRSILPRLGLREALDISRIYSVANALPPGEPLIRTRPFRAPHHTISHAGLVGGGHWPRPGEISLAHRGVLFLDELPEFGARNLETLRQPLEDHVITIARAAGSLTYPVNLVLIAAMNPCPCGFHGDTMKCLWFCYTVLPRSVNCRFCNLGHSHALRKLSNPLRTRVEWRYI
jgi:predicted ATPase with chaperone activity